MKKLNIIGSAAILASAIGLALFRVTGFKVHVVISIIALIIMLVCMILGKKNWKNPKVEILYRVFYLVALITGIVLAKLGSAPAVLSIIHKISAAIFAVLFIASSAIALKSGK